LGAVVVQGEPEPRQPARGHADQGGPGSPVPPADPPGQAEHKRGYRCPPDSWRANREHLVPALSAAAPRLSEIKRDRSAKYQPTPRLRHIALLRAQAQAKAQHRLLVLIPGVQGGPDRHVVAIECRPVPVVPETAREPA